MTDAELDAYQKQIGLRLSMVKAQLADAKSAAASIGIYSNRNWFLRTSAAQRALGAEYNAINSERSRRKTAARAARQVTFDRLFIENAKRMLDSGTFNRIFNAAMAERGEQ